jgi:hypothetical protein
MPWIEWSRKKKLIILTTILMLLIIELYAQNYVPLNELSVVPESHAEAERSGPSGKYEFLESNCRWIVTWVRENPSQSSPHEGYVWIWIYKVSENQSFLRSNTSIVISGITARQGTNGSKDINDLQNYILYEDNRTTVLTEIFFTGSGIYDVRLSLNVKFFQRTPIGILPTGVHTIPMNSTIYVSIGQ